MQTIGHANRGRFFEQYLEHLHARYRVEERARIDFIPTPTRPHKSQGQVTWVTGAQGNRGLRGRAAERALRGL